MSLFLLNGGERNGVRRGGGGAEDCACVCESVHVACA